MFDDLLVLVSKHDVFSSTFKGWEGVLTTWDDWNDFLFEWESFAQVSCWIIEADMGESNTDAYTVCRWKVTGPQKEAGSSSKHHFFAANVNFGGSNFNHNVYELIHLWLLLDWKYI